MLAVFRGGKGCTLCWQSNLVRYKSVPGGIGFECIKGSWRAAEAWQCGRPGEAIGKRAAAIPAEAPGIKGP